MTNAFVTTPLHAPSPLAGSEPLDLIFIDGFVGHTIIGIHQSELYEPQPVAIDVCAGVSRARACDTDRIGDTIDYGELRGRLRRLMADHGVQLLESLAEKVAQIALFELGAEWVRVRIAKPHKFDDTDAVGVMIERRRNVAGNLPASANRAASLRLIGAGLVPGSRCGDDT